VLLEFTEKVKRIIQNSRQLAFRDLYAFNAMNYHAA